MAGGIQVLLLVTICSIGGHVIVDNGQPLEIHAETTDDVTIGETSNGGINGNLDVDDGLCRRCLCKLNGCPNALNAQCLSAGSLCCCCLPGNHPCLEMEQFADDIVTDPSDRSALEALEEGLEEIGQLEKK